MNVGNNYYHGEPQVEEAHEKLPIDYDDYLREHDPKLSDMELCILEIQSGSR